MQGARYAKMVFLRYINCDHSISHALIQTFKNSGFTPAARIVDMPDTSNDINPDRNKIISDFSAEIRI